MITPPRESYQGISASSTQLRPFGIEFEFGCKAKRRKIPPGVTELQKLAIAAMDKGAPEIPMENCRSQLAHVMRKHLGPVPIITSHGVAGVETWQETAPKSGRWQFSVKPLSQKATESIKSGQQKPDSPWHIEKEDDHGRFQGPIWEVVSPVMRGGMEDIARLGKMSTEWWDSQMYTRHEFTSVHVTIDGSCLIDSSSALGALNLLALWEAMYPVMYPLFSYSAPHSPREGHRIFSPAMHKAFPQLFHALMAGPHTVLEVVQILQGVGQPLVEAAGPEWLAHYGRTGLRNMALNMCKLLPVSCCTQCSKSESSTTSTVEFRMFDLIVGQRVHAALVLAQHAVMFACTSASKGTDLRSSLWPRQTDSLMPWHSFDSTAWLEFLQVPHQDRTPFKGL